MIGGVWRWRRLTSYRFTASGLTQSFCDAHGFIFISPISRVSWPITQIPPSLPPGSTAAARGRLSDSPNTRLPPSQNTIRPCEHRQAGHAPGTWTTRLGTKKGFRIGLQTTLTVQTRQTRRLSWTTTIPQIYSTNRFSRGTLALDHATSTHYPALIHIQPLREDRSDSLNSRVTAHRQSLRPLRLTSAVILL